uniref:Uncharacterized protein n=1 Tax=Anguilla anguilla TaxID=7936 RepID=A0A0E9RRT5_ANGAN
MFRLHSFGSRRALSIFVGRRLFGAEINPMGGSLRINDTKYLQYTRF